MICDKCDYCNSPIPSLTLYFSITLGPLRPSEQKMNKCDSTVWAITSYTQSGVNYIPYSVWGQLHSTLVYGKLHCTLRVSHWAITLPTRSMGKHIPHLVCGKLHPTLDHWAITFHTQDDSASEGNYVPHLVCAGNYIPFQ